MVRAFGASDQAQLEDVADPVPSPGEVIVALEASDVNYPDILYVEGTYQAKPPLPFTPGLAGAGKVVVLGTGVTGLHLGQRVAVLPSHGTYADRTSVPEAHCFPMPEAMPYEVAAAFGLAYQSAWFALTERAAIRQGDTVLVLGATGGISMATIQLAKALGASAVIAATRGEAGMRFARECGADEAIDVTMDNLRDGLRAAVLAATDGRGADIVIDPVGGDVHAAALRALAWSGRLVVVGFVSKDIPKIPANYLLVKNITVCGLQWTDYRQRQPDKVRAAQAAIFDLWTQGRLAPVISRILPIERFGEALADLRQGRAKGKIVLTTGAGRASKGGSHARA